MGSGSARGMFQPHLIHCIPNSYCMFYTADKLTQKEAEELMDKCDYFLSNPNVVSINYWNETEKGTRTGRKILRIRVIKIEDISIPLPKIAVYETPTKCVSIPVQIFEEGIIKALAKNS